MRVLFLIFNLILCQFTTASDTPEGQTVNFYITVDWEGVDFKTGILDDSDLLRLKEFRKKFPNYPMVHFMNAAYFTNGELSEEEVAKRIKSILIETDEIGLHLHPWENLVDAIGGIKFIDGPTYFDKKLSPYEGPGNSKYPLGHRGGDIPLWKYPKEDIRKMVRFSVDKLEEHGLGNIKSFRAGGWQTDERVLEVLIEEGFTSESSPVPHQKVSNLYPNTTLEKNVERLWGQTNNLSAPYIHESKAREEILMMPNNAGLADYVDADEFIETFEANIKSNSSKEINLVYGFHFETVEEYLDRLEESILRMEERAKKLGVKIRPATYHQKTPAIFSGLSSNKGCYKLMEDLILHL